MRAALAVIAFSFGTAAIEPAAPIKPSLAKPIPPPKALQPAATPPFAPLATTYVYIAAPQAAPPKRLGTVAVGLNWVCEHTGCKTIAAWPRPLVSSCNLLARQIGPIASFGRSGAMLAPAELDECNKGIEGATMVATGPTVTTAKQQASANAPIDPGSSNKANSAPATQSEPVAGTEPAAEITPAREKQSNAVTVPAVEAEPVEGAPTDSTPGGESPPATSEPPATTAPPAEPLSEPVTQTGTAPSTTATATATSEPPVTSSPAIEQPPTVAPAPLDRGIVISGVGVVVPELQIIGGIQTLIVDNAAPVTVNTSEIRIVGGPQGPTPANPSPLSVQVPELSVVGR